MRDAMAMATRLPRCVFFDVDGTLINVKSVLSFLEFIRVQLALDYEPRFREYYRTLRHKMANREPREELNRFYYTLYRGFAVARVAQLGTEWFAQASRHSGFYNEKMTKTLLAWWRDGVPSVLVTGSFSALLEPLARRLPVDTILCTNLKTQDGVYTGDLDGHPCIGAGKVSAVREFARARDIPLEECFGYADDHTDIPMLVTLGGAVLIRPDAAVTPFPLHGDPDLHSILYSSTTDREHKMTSAVATAHKR